VIEGLRRDKRRVVVTAFAVVRGGKMTTAPSHHRTRRDPVEAIMAGGARLPRGFIVIKPRGLPIRKGRGDVAGLAAV
jgi:hypothetical protein